VFKENKDEMLAYSEILAGHLERLLDSSHKPLQSLTLRLIINLSHDISFRHYFIKHAIFPKIVSMLVGNICIVITIQVLYQFSIDEKNRNVSGFTECIPYVKFFINPKLIRMILEYKGDRIDKDVMALAINLSTVSKHRQILAEDNGIKFLMKRAIKTHDPLLFKMLRLISQHPDITVKIKFLVSFHFND
jgi:hypothetical protein